MANGNRISSLAMPKRILHYTNIGKVECIKTNLFKIFVETHTIFHKKQREQKSLSALPFLPYRIANPRKARDMAREKCKIYPYNPLNASPIPAALRGIHTLLHCVLHSKI